MAAQAETSLAEQRRALQQQLQAQRKQIEYQLTCNATPNQQYPRSITMRFLSGRIGTRLLTTAATLVMGAHYARSISIAGVIFRTFFSKSANK